MDYVGVLFIEVMYLFVVLLLVARSGRDDLLVDYIVLSQ